MIITYTLKFKSLQKHFFGVLISKRIFFSKVLNIFFKTIKKDPMYFHFSTAEFQRMFTRKNLNQSHSTLYSGKSINPRGIPILQS